MYSSIANNSFSYLLTLDEFRKSLSDELRPSWIKITTITMVSSFVQHIDIKKLRSIFETIGSYTMKRTGSGNEGGFNWKLKPTTFHNQVTLTYHDSYSTKSVKVFPNVSIQVAGCCDLFDCTRVIKQLKEMFEKYLDMQNLISNEDFRVVMINSNYSLNYNVNLRKVAEHFSNFSDIFSVSFQPETYSAVKIKFKPAEEMKEITTSIFSTGKIIITGCETLKEVAYGFNMVCRHIDREPSIRVSATSTKDVFDTYLGYQCDYFVQKIKDMGFRSWMLTTTNRQINF